jgi:protein-S-isoprenylcysteine O-methyltransferase Ste14
MKSSYIIKHLIGSLIFFSLIFISAGRIIYWQGLAYLIIGMFMVLTNYTVLAIDPELQKERSKPGENTKKWDKAILGLSFLCTLSMYVTAGLDSGRFHWSPDFHLSLYVIGSILTAAGQLIFLIAQKQNKFFSSTVRIQTDRNHTVCDTGLYKVVRHPAYMGSVIQAIGFPLIFGSLWSIIPVTLLIILHLVRTYLEDKTLKEELSGYTEYATQTPYRIIPFVW